MGSGRPDPRTLIANLTRDFGGPEIVFAVVHGSFHAGGPSHDVDVAVWVDPALLPRAQRQRYALDAAARLTVENGTIVDVQVLNDAALGFRFHALKGTPLVVRDLDLFDEVRARTWDEYFDFLPFARRYLHETLSA